MSGNRKDTNAQPSRAVAAASEAPRTIDATWVHAFQESQRQMADAHTAYQAAMAQSHTAFLQAVSASQAQLTAMITGGVAAPAPQLAMPTIAAPAHPQPVAPAPRPMPAPAPMAAPIAHAPAPAPMAAPPVVSAAPVLPPAPVPVLAAPTASVQDTEQLLLDIVADKTGYPIDMLEPQMQLEADLGIDSIKRVEILSALGEAAPWLPEIDGTQMASLSTLGQIVQFLEASIPAPRNGAAGHAEPATANKPNGSAAAPSNGSLETVLLETVADKTGYPVDMLELQMQLEADLGIDSIKRVEILSAVHDVVPSMPEVDGNAMAKLNTLGEILDFMTDAIGGEKKKPLQMSA